MLVLSRQRDESIVIGDNIIITIVDIRGDKVRLGIDAPKEVPVHRQEVYNAIHQERYANLIGVCDSKNAYDMLIEGTAHIRNGDLEIISGGLNITESSIRASINYMTQEFKNYDIKAMK